MSILTLHELAGIEMNEGALPAVRKTKGRKELMKEAVINSLKAALFLYLSVLAVLLISMKLKDK